MEYYMLTVPICSVPRNVTDMYGAPVSSLPASPTKMPSAESQERRSSALVRKLSGDRSRPAGFASFMEMRQQQHNASGGSGSGTGEPSLTAGKFLDFSIVPPSDQQHGVPRSPMSAHTGNGGGRFGRHARTSDAHSSLASETHSQQSRVAKYEAGEKGLLHPLFISLLEPWMSYCHSIAAPSIFKKTLRLQSKFSVDFVLKELQQSVPSICSEVTLKTFKVIASPDPGQSAYGLPYTPCKCSSRDAHINRHAVASNLPGRVKVGRLAIGRNMKQWFATVQDYQEYMDTSNIKGCRSDQKFVAQVPDSDGKDPSKFVKKHFVPRQKLLLIVCTDKEMTLLMYNWSSDMVANLEKTATGLVQWHNARSHVLGSIIGQKMGLFNHFTFADLHYSPAQNPFTQSSCEVDALIRYHAPPRDYPRRSSSLSAKEKERSFQYPKKRIIHFDQTYKDPPAVKALERVMCNSSQDPVSRHGSQAQELRLLSRQDKQQPQQQQQQQPLSNQPATPQQQQQFVARKDVCETERIPVSSVPDPVFQQGKHLCEVKRLIHHEEERTKLYQLYVGWFQTNWKNNANHPVLEDYLVQLKQAGRLFHYCATPLIFSTQWRQAVVQKTMGRGNGNASSLGGLMSRELGSSNPSIHLNHTASAAGTSHTPGHGYHGAGGSISNMTTPATPDKNQKMRSRHSSGTSNISAKVNTEDGVPGILGRKGSGQADPAAVSGGGGGGFGSSRSIRMGGDTEVVEEMEEAWHLELRRRFLYEYQQYLVSELGFITLNVQPNAPRRGQPTWTMPGHSDASAAKKAVGPVNLQKTLTGGIIVMELSFRQEFFCVKMFAVDCSQLQVIVNQQMHLIFVDECDKYKDLIHVHSFAHDFHLRCVQHYLAKSDASLCFPDRFDLDNFLTDFRQIYPYPPSFSRNCLQQECVTLPDLPFPGEMLYNYMLKQMGSQEMRVLRMADKFALVKLSSLYLPHLGREQDNFPSQGETTAADSPDCSRKYSQDGSPPPEGCYDAGLVIINNSGPVAEDPMKLVLKYFTVLTRQRDCYPIRRLEKALGEFGGKSVPTGGNAGILSEPCKPVAVKQHIGLRKEHVNYRGYSNAHQSSLYAALVGQSGKGKEKILEMVKISEKKCRRDYLWQRLVVTRPELEDGGNKRRSDTSDSSESVPTLSPLTSREFSELLESVTVTPLNEIDTHLSPLFNMPQEWHQGLFSVLMNKYPEAYRCLHSPDRKTQYILVLNANNLDMFAMLSLNKSEGKTELCAVMKEPVADDSMHSPSQPNLPLYSLQTHVEDFVNVCCYHVWSSMLH